MTENHPPNPQFIPPPPVTGDASIPQLLAGNQAEQDAKMEEILNMVKNGIDLNTIATIKGTTLEELMAFMHLNSINVQEVPQIEVEPLDDVGAKPSMVDREKKTRRQSWKQNMFPKLKPKEGKYYCADCEKPNKSYHCDVCRRKCWKYCDKCDDPGFYSNHHGCFKKASNGKRRRRWTTADFPTEKLGVYYCADCAKSNARRSCSCGRESWKWCDICNCFLSKHHFPCSVSEVVLDSDRQDHEEVFEPPLKKRKLD